jgi:hypothetical protein
MSQQQLPTRRKTFTVQQANATLPLVRAIVSDLVQLAKEVFDRRRRLTLLFEGRRRDASGPYGEELAQIEEGLDRDTLQLQEYIEELEQVGVELKSATEGLVDFPAILEDREVYLCWKLGEPEVGYWHELEEGYQGRQPLPPSRIPSGRPSTS